MKLTHENVTWLYVNAFVDEFARAGISHVCLCPGSRSTPLAMMFAENGAFKLWMQLDERACGFFALGLAKARREPVILLCTSGTASANFLPAIVEASLEHVPLIVLTADRPPELRDTGAAQTIDQLKLYGNYAKWFAEIALPEADAEMLRYARTMAGRAVATASQAPAGVVHFNMPFREPLIPLKPEIEVSEAEQDAFLGRAGGAPFVRVALAGHSPDAEQLAGLAKELAGKERGIIVAGMQNRSEFPEAAAQLSRLLGYPLLADPLSGARCGIDAQENVIDSYDAFLRDVKVAERLKPEIILRFGAIPTSKPVLQYMQRHGDAEQILVDDEGWNDPTHLASMMVRGDAAQVIDGLREAIHIPARTSEWLRTWQEINRCAGSAVREQIATYGEFFEGRVFTELADALPDGATLFASSSMPVRDLDTFFPASGKKLRFLSNRGANGIDGVVSTAIGAAAASRGPLVLVIGDLALYHDMNGLLAAKLHALNALIVLVNNDGGGIFSFLPQAAYPAHFEQLFGTPHGLEFEHAARLYGARYADVRDWNEFRERVREDLDAPGLKIVQVKTDRERNVTMHRAVWQAVSKVVAGI